MKPPTRSDSRRIAAAKAAEDAEADFRPGDDAFNRSTDRRSFDDSRMTAEKQREIAEIRHRAAEEKAMLRSEQARRDSSAMEAARRKILLQHLQPELRPRYAAHRPLDSRTIQKLARQLVDRENAAGLRAIEDRTEKHVDGVRGREDTKSETVDRQQEPDGVLSREEKRTLLLQQFSEALPRTRSAGRER